MQSELCSGDQLSIIEELLRLARTRRCSSAAASANLDVATHPIWSAQSLSSESNRLKLEVDKFLATVRAASGRPTGCLRIRHRPGSVVTCQPNRRRAPMIEPKLEVPIELRDLAEKTIDQAEKAFGMFFDAANKSVASIPSPGTEVSKQALSFTEQNMKAAFEHARKLVHATDLQQAMQIQSEFLKSQFTNAGEHMRQITGEVMSAARDATKPKS
jgi:phasin